MEHMMRRKEKAMNETEIIEMLQTSTVGRLGTCLNNEPYIVPVNYIYLNGDIYFHCAVEGKKLDYIRGNKNVCFEADEMVNIVESQNPCNMSTNYRSVIAFGMAEIIEDGDIKLDILKKIVDKYSIDKTVSSKLQKNHINSTCIVKVSVEKVTGKKSLK